MEGWGDGAMQVAALGVWFPNTSVLRRLSEAPGVNVRMGIWDGSI
jgi:hypothetical protein